VPYTDAEAAERLTGIESALREGLGDQRLAELKARGAALDTADAVAYLRKETGALKH
jgi:hypothetical protein